MNELKMTGKLVGPQELLNELFSDECRPSLRWLRTQTKARAIPCIRIGHLVFFNVEMVRAHLTERRLAHVGRPPRYGRSRLAASRPATENGDSVL